MSLKKTKLSKEEKIAMKEEKKKIAQINSSLTYFSASIQNELGAIAIQKDDNVFYCGNNIYKKIYVIRPAVLTDKKLIFLKGLVQLFSNRIRLSLSIKNQNGNVNGSMFMTVFFEHDTYYEAKQEIMKFEAQLNSKICRILGITITQCNLDQILSFISLNVNGELRNISSDYLFEKKSSFNCFDNLSDAEAGYFRNKDKYGVALIGKYFPLEGKDFNNFLRMNEGNYQIVFDFQAISDDDKELFRMLLEGKYNSKLKEQINDDFINLTYFIIVQTPEKETIKKINKDAFRFFDDNNIVIMPGMNREIDMFVSSCTLGLRDFHLMQNTKINIAANLLI